MSHGCKGIIITAVPSLGSRDRVLTGTGTKSENPRMDFWVGRDPKSQLIPTQQVPLPLDHVEELGSQTNDFYCNLENFFPSNKLGTERSRKNSEFRSHL